MHLIFKTIQHSAACISYSRLFSILQHASHFSTFCSMHLILTTFQHSAACISYSRLFSILQHASHIQDYSAFCSMHLKFKTIQHSAACISYSRLFSILQHASHTHKTYTVFYSIGFTKLWRIYIKLFENFHYSFISTEDEKLIILKI